MSHHLSTSFPATLLHRVEFCGGSGEFLLGFSELRRRLLCGVVFGARTLVLSGGGGGVFFHFRRGFLLGWFYDGF
jgi:hypothetical protein